MGGWRVGWWGLSWDPRVCGMDALLGGGVCTPAFLDRWFVVELLRLDFHLCDLSFDRHGSGSEKGVHPLAPPPSWHPRLLGTPAFLAPPPSWHPRLLGTPAFLAPLPSWHPRHSWSMIECDICVLFFAGTGASWRVASLEVVVPWTICISSNSVGFGLLFCVHRLCF